MFAEQFTSNESTDDLQPKRLPPVGGSSSSPSMVDVEFVPNYALNTEEWFHGPISRKESELLVIRDGDFLVRESQVSSGQYVLTGMQSSCRKHLLLVDPEGVVSFVDSFHYYQSNCTHNCFIRFVPKIRHSNRLAI